MDELAYASALALAVVFAAAGTAKLRRRRLTERTFRSLGLAWPRALATAVPATEAALAVGLVVVPAWAGVAAVAVLAGFTTFLVRSHRRGDRLGCGCFGARRPVDSGPSEVARNCVLLAGAALVAFGAERPVVPGIVAVAIVALTAGSVAAVLARMRQRPGGGAQRPPQGLAPGSPAPPLPGAGPPAWSGTTLVAFVAPSCEGCGELRASLARAPRGDVTVRVVDLDDRSSPVFAAYGVRSAPYVVVVDGDGRVRASGPARSPSELDRLLAPR